MRSRPAGVSHQLYLLVYYRGDWHFFNRASSEDATPLELIDIDSSVVSCASSYRGCLLSETVGVSVEDLVLRDRRARGYAIKVSARSGSERIVQITPEQIQQQLEAVDQYLATLGEAR